MADANYISKADYKGSIRTERLNQILEEADEDEDVILDGAESEALGVVRKYLGVRYNMDTEFAKTGNDRNRFLLRCCKVLVIYYIYERIPDEMVPERVVKNYNEVMDALERIEDSKGEVPGLTPNTTTGTDGESKPVTRRRWGSVPKRANDAGNYRDKRW